MMKKAPIALEKSMPTMVSILIADQAPDAAFGYAPKRPAYLALIHFLDFLPRACQKNR